MNKSTWGGIAAAVLIALGVGWYFASPTYAMSGLRDAAIEGDADALEDRIDFPSVRESLKSQMQVMLMAEMQKETEDNPFGAMGGMMVMGMLGPMVDNMVTPDGMAALIKQGKLQRGAEAAAPDGEPVEWEIERDGFSRFRASPVGEETSAALIFERDGLGWKLARMELPTESAIVKKTGE